MEVLNENRIARHRLNVEQYRRMGEAGVLEPGARVELIEGEVIDLHTKARLYASHGVVAYWVFDLAGLL